MTTRRRRRAGRCVSSVAAYSRKAEVSGPANWASSRRRRMEELVEALCVVLREGGGLVAWAEETCDAEVVAVLVEADGAELEREFAGEVVVVEFADAEEVVEGFAESAESALAFAVVEAAGVAEGHGGGEFVSEPEGEAALAHAGLGLDGLDAGVAAGDDRKRRLHEGAAVVAAAYERGVGSQRGVGGRAVGEARARRWLRGDVGRRTLLAPLCGGLVEGVAADMSARRERLHEGGGALRDAGEGRLVDGGRSGCGAGCGRGGSRGQGWEACGVSAEHGTGCAGEGAEPGAEGVGGADALCGVLLECIVDERFEPRRDHQSGPRHKLGRGGVDLGVEDGIGGGAGEGVAPCDGPEEHESDGVEVGSGRQVGVAAGLLGGHEEGRSDDASGRGEVFALALVVVGGDAEVDDFGVRVSVGVARQEDVAGLDVAVNDAARVGVGEAGEELLEDLADLGEGELLAAEHVGERDAFDELHGEVELPVFGGAEVEDHGDVGVAKRGDRAAFTDEALTDPLVAGEVGAEHLERDGPVERLLDGLEDGSCAAGADDRCDAESPCDEGSGGEFHDDGCCLEECEAAAACGSDGLVAGAECGRGEDVAGVGYGGAELSQGLAEVLLHGGGDALVGELREEVDGCLAGGFGRLLRGDAEQGVVGAVACGVEQSLDVGRVEPGEAGVCGCGVGGGLELVAARRLEAGGAFEAGRGVEAGLGFEA
jgi:hypothetical protein